jgi:hypothetical protein
MPFRDCRWRTQKEKLFTVKHTQVSVGRRVIPKAWELQLRKWIRAQHELGLPLSPIQIRQKAQQLTKYVLRKPFMASNTWYRRFMTRSKFSFDNSSPKDVSTLGARHNEVSSETGKYVSVYV